MTEILLHSKKDLKAAAEKILRLSEEKKVFAFTGELGAGKTTLIKEICRQLGAGDLTASPTFAIVNEYYAPQKIYHIDLFRIESERELVDIGIEEYVNSGSFCFIEWADKFESLIPDDCLHINIRIMNEEQRMIACW